MNRSPSKLGSRSLSITSEINKEAQGIQILGKRSLHWQYSSLKGGGRAEEDGAARRSKGIVLLLYSWRSLLLFLSCLSLPLFLPLSLSPSLDRISNIEILPDSILSLVSYPRGLLPPRTKTQLDEDGLSIKYARVTGGIDREIGPIVLNYEGSTDRDIESRRSRVAFNDDRG